MPDNLSIPNHEILWLTVLDGHGAIQYRVTSTPLRDKYFLYTQECGKWKKRLTGPNPAALATRYKEE